METPVSAFTMIWRMTQTLPPPWWAWCSVPRNSLVSMVIISPSTFETVQVCTTPVSTTVCSSLVSTGKVIAFAFDILPLSAVVLNASPHTEHRRRTHHMQVFIYAKACTKQSKTNQQLGQWEQNQSIKHTKNTPRVKLA